MTMVRTEHKTCCVCGETIPVSVCLSYSQFGKTGPTLDGWHSGVPYGCMVEFCRHCGYASHDIAESPVQPGVMNTKPYRDILKQRWIDDSCKAYLCVAQFKAADGDFKGAFWASIRAAWICDNDGYWQGAEDYRTKALEMMRRSHEKGGIVSDTSVRDGLLQADLLRRTGSFQQAKDAVMRTLKCNPDAELMRLLRFEQRLIEQVDKAAHWAKEA